MNTHKKHSNESAKPYDIRFDLVSAGTWIAKAVPHGDKETEKDLFLVVEDLLGELQMVWPDDNGIVLSKRNLEETIKFMNKHRARLSLSGNTKM